MKKLIFIVLMAGAAMATYLAWSWLSRDPYERCIVRAAKESNGIPWAYGEMRSICRDERKKRKNSPKGASDDLQNAPRETYE